MPFISVLAAVLVLLGAATVGAGAGAAANSTEPTLKAALAQL